MGNCPYIDGCFEKEFRGVSSENCNGDYASQRCYMVEDIVRIWIEEWERDDLESEVFEFN